MAAEEEDLDRAPGMRPFWSGTITFGLVSVPVSLFPANRPAGVSLRMVTGEGTPLQRRYVCSKDGEELSWDDIVRGYEIEKGRFVVVTDDELEAIAPQKSREIDLQLFVEREEIDPMYFERAYFLTPAAGSNKAYRLLAEVMERTGRAGLATFVMRSKEYLVAILAENGILRAETLRFADEVRSADDVGLPAKPSAKPADVKKFERAIEKLTGSVDFSEFIDTQSERLQKVVEAKRKKGEGLVRAKVADAAPEEEGGEVIDLLAALRKSLGAAGTKSAGAAKRRTAPAKKSGGKKSTARKAAGSTKRKSPAKRSAAKSRSTAKRKAR